MLFVLIAVFTPSNKSVFWIGLPLNKHAMLMQGYSEFLGITPPFFIQCSNTSVLSDLQASSNPSDSPFNFAPLLIK
ncbi:hypothetical protein AX774_g7092 [Zancudomyces culisetae]|uniref:Uncharacterized protein n=1 Tax=Zancudomyces culisetae TaxID=1213189 RepID=A0A1R1PEV9_ZANCU|nr:hypothetical protein AX774_g7092 [Zancudomyces culisetae]|eukprot:OMH79491.1 hypothetical protein AX774_g7092 [Zancudomyces culisetae]